VGGKKTWSMGPKRGAGEEGGGVTKTTQRKTHNTCWGGGETYEGEGGGVKSLKGKKNRGTLLPQNNTVRQGERSREKSQKRGVGGRGGGYLHFSLPFWTGTSGGGKAPFGKGKSLGSVGARWAGSEKKKSHCSRKERGHQLKDKKKGERGEGRKFAPCSIGK